MEEAGRNDPCPCGISLKYKKCCLSRLVPLGAATYRLDVAINTDESAEEVAVHVHNAVKTAIRIAIFESDVAGNSRELWERDTRRMMEADPSGNYEILFDGKTVYLTVMILTRTSVEELTRTVAVGAKGPKKRMTIASAAKIKDAEAFWSEAVKTEVNLRSAGGQRS